MLRSIFLVALAVALFPSATAQSQNEPICASRRFIENQLKERFNEMQIGVGGSHRGVVELWSTLGGETWSITLTEDDGNTCIMITGLGWFELRRTAR